MFVMIDAKINLRTCCARSFNGKIISNLALIEKVRLADEDITVAIQ